MFQLPVDTPKFIKRLPRDPRGFPVPFFVRQVPGEAPDLRIADTSKKLDCIRYRRCWICGKPLKKMLALVGGPCSFATESYGDPPSHPNCAEFAMKYCPFLNQTTVKYRMGDEPEGTIAPEGMTLHQPNISGLIYFRTPETFRHGDDLLTAPRDVSSVHWYHRGEEIEPAKAAELWIPQPDVEEKLISAVRNSVEIGRTFRQQGLTTR